MGGPGDTVSKVDLLIGYVKSLVAANEQVLARLRAGDAMLATHAAAIDELKRRIGKKSKPEPHWLVRAVAIAVASGLATALVHWLLKGGLAAGVGA